MELTYFELENSFIKTRNLLFHELCEDPIPSLFWNKSDMKIPKSNVEFFDEILVYGTFFL